MAWAERRGRRWRARWTLPDGSVGSSSGHPTKAAALAYGNAVEADARRGRGGDPRKARITLADWVPIWRTYLNVSPVTEANYSYRLAPILERWGDARLSDVTWLGVRAWAGQLDASPRTVADTLSVFSMLLSAAVDDDRLARNPLYRRRLGARAASAERVWVTPEQALAIADRCDRDVDQLLILTAMWTGCRWGELAGLHRANCGLLRRGDGVRRSVIRVEQALHEHPRTHERWLGPPKPPNGAREVDLPPFLAELLAAHLAGWPHEFVFTKPTGEWLVRSLFRTRVLQPALRGADEHQPIIGKDSQPVRFSTPDGLDTENAATHVHIDKRGAVNLDRPVDTAPVRAHRPIQSPISDFGHGLTFHGLRHSHKTLLIELGVPEVLQCERLGHAQPGVRGIYSHVAGPVRAAMLDGLQARWERPVSAAAG